MTDRPGLAVTGGDLRTAEDFGDKLRPLLLAAFAACLPLSIAIQQLALGLLIALLGWRFRQAMSPRRSSLDWPLAAFLASLLLSSLLSPDVLASLASFRRLWLVAAFFAAYQLIEEPEEAERMVFALVVSATAVAAYGIVQHFTGLDLARQMVGKPSNLDPGWLGGEGTYRTKGLHPSGITFAHNLLFPLAFAATLLSHPGLTLGRRAGLFGALVLMVVSLFFSLTRGVWLAALLLIALLGALRGGRRLLWLLGAVAVPAALLLAGSAPLRARALSSFDLEANVARREIWRANLDMIAARPVLGWGWGNYRKFRSPYYARYQQVDTTAHAHNNFLQIWTEGGLLALAGFLYLVWAILRSAWRASRLADEPLQAVALGAFLAIVGFLAAGLTQYNFGDAEVAISFWLTAALAARAGDFALARARLPGRPLVRSWRSERANAEDHPERG